MNTLTGLSEFAQNRSQADVANITTKILTTTQQTDDKIINLTSKIQDGGMKLHKSFEGTTKGFTRVYNEAEALNIAKNFNLGKYSFNLAKRVLVQFHRNFEKFNSQFGDYTKIVDIANKNINTVKDLSVKIKKIHEALNNVDESLTNFDKSLTQENLDKVYEQIEQVRILSEDIEKGI